MELRHIPLENLKPTPVNVRHAKKTPDVSDILPSIKKRGILQPLLVRPNGSGFEVVAGRRRYFAAVAAKAEIGTFDPIPCAIMEQTDDATAIEASLLENFARLPMEPMQQYEAFAKLIKEGKAVADIAETFGVTTRMVTRVLALANLIPAIKTAYRNEKIDHGTLRILTMASKSQQREWLKLLKCEDRYAPIGEGLKRWLFGGDKINTTAALFDLKEYTAQIVTDLFGEDAYFADANQFWQLQKQAIEARKQTLIEAGWASVEIFERGAYFSEWEYEKTPKKKGGRVFVTIRDNGETTFHEGYVSLKEARAKGQKANDGVDADTAQKPTKPEITKAMQTYLELHRHALVRAELLKHTDIALRLSVAHMIAGSHLWAIRPEPQRAPKVEIEVSVQSSASQTRFDAERTEILVLLDMDETRAELVRHTGDCYWTAICFAKLLTLSDEDVMRIMAFAMAETLQSGSCLVEALGVHRNVSAKAQWQVDDIFIDLLKDKSTINAVLEHIGGNDVAAANANATGKVQKGIIADHLNGTNGRKQIKEWIPNWLKFPFAGHTNTPIETTGIGREWKRIATVFADKKAET